MRCHDRVDGQAEKNKVTAAQHALESAIEASVTKAAVAAMGKGGFSFKGVAEGESEPKEVINDNKVIEVYLGT